MYCERDRSRSVLTLIKGGTAANRKYATYDGAIHWEKKQPVNRTCISGTHARRFDQIECVIRQTGGPSRRHESAPGPARVRCPIPFEIDRPRRDVREHNDRL